MRRRGLPSHPLPGRPFRGAEGPAAPAARGELMIITGLTFETADSRRVSWAEQGRKSCENLRVLQAPEAWSVVTAGSLMQLHGKSRITP